MNHYWDRASNGTFTVRDSAKNRVAICHSEADAKRVTNALNGTNTLSLGALRHANIQRATEWETNQPATLSFMGNEFAGEVGEALEQAVGVIMMGVHSGRACNIAKKIERESMGWAGSVASLDDFFDEIGDVVVCADRLVRKLGGPDLGVIAGNKFNKTSEKLGFKTRIILP